MLLTAVAVWFGARGSGKFPYEHPLNVWLLQYNPPNMLSLSRCVRAGGCTLPSCGPATRVVDRHIQPLWYAVLPAAWEALAVWEV